MGASAGVTIRSSRGVQSELKSMPCQERSKCEHIREDPLTAISDPELHMLLSATGPLQHEVIEREGDKVDVLKYAQTMATDVWEQHAPVRLPRDWIGS